MTAQNATGPEATSPYLNTLPLTEREDRLLRAARLMEIAITTEGIAWAAVVKRATEELRAALQAYKDRP